MDTQPASHERHSRCWHHRWRRFTTAVAAVPLLAVVVVLALGRDDSAGAADASATQKASAEQVARGFLDAYGAFDADRAMTFLTKRAVATEWTSPSEFRFELALLRAIGWKQTIGDPRMPVPDLGSDGCDAYDFVVYKKRLSAGRLIVYCTYVFHGLGSDALRRGPYGDGYWAIVVDDGRILSAENRIDTEHSAFEQQMWQPFHRWVSSAYPRDVATMYEGGSAKWKRSEASVRLWELHSAEYVAAGTPYVDRVNAICSAAHDRLNNLVGRPPETGPFDAYFQTYNLVAARVLDETLDELRSTPPPEPFRPDFDFAYSMGDALVRQLRGAEELGVVGRRGVRHALGALGLHECTFDLPG